MARQIVILVLVLARRPAPPALKTFFENPRFLFDIAIYLWYIAVRWGAGKEMKMKVVKAVPVVYGNMTKAEKKAAEKAQAEAKAELLARLLPGCALRLWQGGGGFGFKAEHARVYVTRDGQDMGYIGIRRTGRRPSGYYERHRVCKGEDFYDVERVATIEDDALIAALIAAAAEWCERTDRAESADDDDRFEYTFGELAE
jgi:hypothetical protein